MISKKPVIALSLITSLLFAACGQGPQTQEVSYPEDVRIVYVAKNVGNPYFDSIERGFQQAAQELGFQFTHVGPATAEATSQIPLIQQQVQRGIHVLTISPNSVDALNQTFRRARERGVMVLSVNSDITGNESFRDGAIFPMDFNLTGSSQIELLGSLIDYQGKFAILSSTTDAPDQNFWIEGMREALKNPKYAEMELVTIVYGDDDPQKSLLEAEALLTRYRDLRGIISPTTVGLAAAAQAVESSNRAPQLQVTGLGTPNQMRRFIENGTVTAFALWDPSNVGYVSGYMGVMLTLGELELKPGTTFDTQSRGTFEIGENGMVIAGPPLVFTRENIGDFRF